METLGAITDEQLDDWPVERILRTADRIVARYKAQDVSAGRKHRAKA